MQKIIILLIYILSFIPAKAQLFVMNENAVCTININNKIYELNPNQIGVFPRVYNIEPNAKVSIELYYPNATTGEKVALSVEDGGKLENGKWVEVVHLNGQKKCLFNFQVTGEPGLFKISAYKGMDTKVIQLWVGAEPLPAKTNF